MKKQFIDLFINIIFYRKNKIIDFILIHNMNSMTTLILRNLPENMLTHILYDSINELGYTIDYAYVCIDYCTKKCTGIGFINFTCSKEATQFKNDWTGLLIIARRECSRNKKYTPLNIIFAKDQGLAACIKRGIKKSKYTNDITLLPVIKEKFDLESKQNNNSIFTLTEHRKLLQQLIFQLLEKDLL